MLKISTGTVISPEYTVQNRPAAAPPKEGKSTPCVMSDKVSISTDSDPDTHNILNSTTVAQLVGSKMKSGDTVTITADGKQVLQIKKESAGSYEQFKTFANDTFHTMEASVSDILNQDRAFAFKEGMYSTKDYVMQGLPSDWQPFVDKGFLPTYRIAALWLDSQKAMSTFRGKDATTMDKFIDGGHLATDIAGLGGAFAQFVPSLSTTTAALLTTAGLMGDWAALTYHLLKYAADRGIPLPDPTNPPPSMTKPTPPGGGVPPNSSPGAAQSANL